GFEHSHGQVERVAAVFQDRLLPGSQPGDRVRAPIRALGSVTHRWPSESNERTERSRADLFKAAHACFAHHADPSWEPRHSHAQLPSTPPNHPRSFHG